MSKIIIATVGTSLLSNYNSKEIEEILEGTYNNLNSFINENISKISSEYSNRKARTAKEQIKSFFRGITKNENNEWGKSDNKNYINIDASAEIKSIIKIQAESKSKVEVHLLHSDSILGQFCAEVIKEFFEEELKDNNIEIKGIICINNLKPDISNKFEEDGLINLIDEVEKIANNKDKEIILNITGGYKGVIPYMTLIGQLNGYPLKYIFESSDEIITIPQLPIGFDFVESEKLYFDLKTACSPNNKELSEDDLKILKEKGFLKDSCGGNFKYELTSLGKFFIGYAEEKLFSSQNLMGWTIEFKALEKLREIKYQNLLNIEHSNNDLNEYAKSNYNSNKEVKGGEIDIVLKKNGKDLKSNKNEYISIELKSYVKLKSHFESDILYQGYSRIAEMLINDCLPKEYWIIVYTSYKNEFARKVNDGKIKQFEESIQNVGLKEIIELLKKKNLEKLNNKIGERIEKLEKFNSNVKTSKIKVKVFNIFIKTNKIDKDSKTIYKDFMLNSLSDNDFKQIYGDKI